MLKSIKRKIVNNIRNVPGWSTKRHLIAITSDDWGSMRSESVKTREALISLGIKMDSNRFDRFDTLETNEDLEKLFEVLLKYKDKNGNHPIMTLMTNVANPDFGKIKRNNYESYFWVPFTETLKLYNNHDKVYKYYLSGIDDKIILPEFHGREHLNITRWIRYLQYGDPIVRRAFENHFFLLKEQLKDIKHRGLGVAFDFDHISELEIHKGIIKEGLELFEQLFKYKSSYFTAPSGEFNSIIEKQLLDSGIFFLDVPKFRRIPLGGGQYRNKFHFLGQKNKFSQYYLTRNAVFEPNMTENSDGVEECLKDIEYIFRWNKPAIISNHRAAFVGGIDIGNRDKGIRAFDKLLNKILEKWPDAEFISASQLGNLIKNNN